MDQGTQPAREIPAGKSGAILTLADGTKVVLDSMNNGLLAQQNGADISHERWQARL